MPVRLLIFSLMAAASVACSPDVALTSRDGPRLVGERDLNPTDLAEIPTLAVLPTVTPVIAQTIPPPTERVDVPIATVEEDVFIVVTPTLQPSKTPTVTPTEPQFATANPTPTVTVTAPPTATDDQFVFRGIGQSSNAEATAAVEVTRFADNAFIQPPSQADGVAAAQCTAIPWWFDDFSPAACPQEGPITGHGTFQPFAFGFMVWTEHNDKVYVMYNSLGEPRWQLFDDPYIDGTPEIDPNWQPPPNPAPATTWQPRRGFGAVWRDFPAVRQRVGWAAEEYETIYTPRTQVAEDGSITLEHPSGGVFYLAPRGADWSLYLPDGF